MPILCAFSRYNSDIYNAVDYYLVFVTTARTGSERRQAIDSCILMGGAGYEVQDGIFTDIVFAAYSNEGEAGHVRASLGFKTSGIMFLHSPRLGWGVKRRLNLPQSRRLYEFVFELTDNVLRLQKQLSLGEIQKKQLYSELEKEQVNLQAALNDAKSGDCDASVFESASELERALGDALAGLYKTSFESRHIATLGIKCVLEITNLRKKLG